jgi:hypothetical protein
MLSSSVFGLSWQLSFCLCVWFALLVGCGVFFSNRTQNRTMFVSCLVFQKTLFFKIFFWIVWFAFFNFSCCCGSALFQQQPTGFAEASVFVSASEVYCCWLHFDSASTSIPDLKKPTRLNGPPPSKSMPQDFY